jgi:hypothetical protein
MADVVTRPKVRILVADEAWIAAALLHRDHPDREDFTVREIVDRARKEHIAGRLRPGVLQHVVHHGVANRPPRPARYRMFYATGRNRRRLYREGDPVDPGRTGKSVPEAEAIPPRYRPLLDWYRNEYAAAPARSWLGGIFEMIGAGKGIFAGEDPDAYVRTVREGWD